MSLRRCAHFTFLFLSLFFLAGVSTLTAQNDDDSNCLTFDGLTPGDKFGGASGAQPGDIFHVESNVPVRLKPFQYQNGETGFQNVSVWKEGQWNNFGDNRFLFIGNISLLFDFTRLDGPVDEVCFKFFYGGGEINFAVNGGELIDFPVSLDGEVEIAPGVTARLELEDDDHSLPKGTLCLSGAIDSFLLGGQEFALDEVCYHYAHEQDACNIQAVKARITGCNPDGGYDLWVDLDYREATDAGFRLSIEGQDFGAFAFDDLPLELHDVQIPTDALTFTVAACTARPHDDPNDEEECCRYAMVEKLACPPAGECALGNLRFYDLSCSAADNTYRITIDFNYSGTGDKFVLATAGGFRGEFAYSDLPLTLENLPVPVGNAEIPKDVIEICDLEKDNCCLRLEVQLPCRPGECAIGPIRVYEVECLDNGTYNATIKFEYRGTGEKFTVKSGETYVHMFRYDELPVRLTGVPVSLAGDARLVVCDAEREDCCQDVTVSLPCQPMECAIGPIRVYEVECLDGGTYNATIKFEHRGTGEKFTVRSGDSYLHTYRYEDLPVRLTGVPRTAAGGAHLLVCDAERQDCCEDVTVELPCQPGECEIGQVHVFDVECLPNGTINASIKFEYRGTGEKFFVKTHTGYAGVFRYDQLPVRLRGVSLPVVYNAPVLEDFFQICDADHPDCCQSASVELPCYPRECDIEDLHIYDIECNDDGTYNATLTFDHRGTGEKFVLKTAGGFRETYAYADLPIRLRGLARPAGDGENYFQVCDARQEGCCARESVDLSCPPQSCRIGGLRVAATPCDENGRYFIRLTFQTNRPATGSFVLEVNGRMRGIYRYGDLPLNLGPFEGPLTEEQIIVVYDKNNPDCRTRTVLEPFECPPPSCALGEVVAYDIECLPDGTYNATFKFRHRANGEKFALKTAGGFEGEFSYDELPLRLTGLPIPTGETGLLFEDHIQVCDLSNEACCAETDLFLPCRDQCALSDMAVRVMPCTGDGVFSVVLDFSHDNVGDGFTLYVNEELYGQFGYDELPLTIDQLPGNGEVLDFRAVDDTYGCLTQRRIEALTCDGQCQFAQLSATRTDCEDGKFFVDLNFVPNYTNEGGFLAFANGQISGPYSYDQLPLRLGPFQADGRTTYNFLLLDLTDPTCYGYAEVGPVDCGQDCRISHLNLRFQECGPEGVYRYLLNFEYDNPGNRFFDVYLGRYYVGNYRLADLPVRLNLHLSDDNEENYALTVCINDQPNCCARIRLERPDCFQEGDDQEVWPGDANTDRIANNLDLLHLGVAFGARGPARLNATTDWEGILAEPWPQSFANGTNFKHADTNGDGVIDEADKAIILANYNRTHGTPRSIDPLPGTDYDPPVFVDLPQTGELPTGEAFEVPVMLGTADARVEDIYGLAFTITFDPDVIDPSSVELVFPTSWFGEPGVNVITLDKSFAGDGFIEVALSRTDQNPVSGYGPIALLRGIIDDIAGIAPAPIESEVGIEGVIAIGPQEELIRLGGKVQKLAVKPAAQDPGKIDLERGLRVFPNPTPGNLRITNQHGQPVEWIDVLDAKGQRVGQRLLQRDELSLDGLPEGLYLLRMKIGDHLITRRVVKLNDR